MKENFLGYRVDAVPQSLCVSDIVRHIRSGVGAAWLACLNPHSYVVSLRDERFARALESAQWLVPDGVGIVFASRLLDGRIRERVTGFDIFSGVHEQLARSGGARIFLLGSVPETLQAVRSRLANECPGLHVCGTYSPPFRDSYSDAENEEIRAAVNSSAPDVLWVAMTAPKQEKWIAENLPYLKVKFVGAVGAVFDFYTGNVRRSAPAFQRYGLEWLPRLAQQPRRLWRRTFVSAPIFVGHVLQEKWRRW